MEGYRDGRVDMSILGLFRNIRLLHVTMSPSSNVHVN